MKNSPGQILPRSFAKSIPWAAQRQRKIAIFLTCFFFCLGFKVGAEVVFTGTFDPRCGYPQHICGTSSTEVWFNVHWAGVLRDDYFFIYNDRNAWIAQLAVSPGGGSGMAYGNTFYMCDCVPGVYEAADYLAVRASSWYYGDQLPASGGDYLTGVVTPGTNCTDGCAGGPQNTLVLDVYLGGTVTNSYTKPCDLTNGGDDCASCASQGMARYNAHSMLASLHLVDTPVGYQPPRGLGVNFTATYNQREGLQPATFHYSNLGPKWTFNWLSYVTDDPLQQFTTTFVYVAGGGSEGYRFDSGTQTFSRDPQSHALLVRTSPSTYEKQLPDGSKQIFTLSDAATFYPRKIFMTQWIDPAGNAFTFAYDSSFRITTVTDALGQVTTLSYEQPDDPLKITKVIDPFGRSAILEYTDGHLTRITDPVGIQSQFAYTPGTDHHPIRHEYLYDRAIRYE